MSRLKNITKRADRVQRRYGSTMKGDSKRIDPKWKITPKGTNPFKKRLGIRATRKW